MKALIPSKIRDRYKDKSGQAMVEYIIIVVIVAIAAIAIIASFSDTLQNLWGGATDQLGGDGSARTGGQELLQQLGSGSSSGGGSGGGVAP